MPVHEEGLQAILETYFGGASSKPATLYVLLVSDTSIADDADLGDLTEVSGDGYARQSIVNSVGNVTSAETGTHDWKVTLATVTFVAAGTWTIARRWVLATSADNSGKLVASDVLTDGDVTLEAAGELAVPVVIQGVG